MDFNERVEVNWENRLMVDGNRKWIAMESNKEELEYEMSIA